MSNYPKKRNMRNEYRFSFLWNLIALFSVATGGFLLMPESGPIGVRSMLVLYIIDAFVMLTFMCLMEKYTITISGLYEKTVITVLSGILTLVVMCAINLFLFTNFEKFVADIIICIAKMAIIFIADFCMDRILGNEKLYQKAKLLILSDVKKNFMRMKRIRYGVLKNYDSWYESVDEMKTEELRSFVLENFPKYDAICLLDGFDEEDYHFAVSQATELNRDLFIVPQMIDVGKTNARLVRFDDVLTLYMPEKNLSEIEFFLKRAMDIVIASVGFIVAAIPMVVIAALIKLTSPGPVFYKQTRLTQNKKEFEIYKFRTMIPDAEKLSGPKFAEKDDPRITPIGKILRSCRLDELPQILNILKGDMSVVGPRPERPVFVEQFEQEIENYDYRFAVKAGLTSLSHVYGRYSTYIHDRTYYDLFYITHYSLFLDIKIMLLTAKTMFLKSAAEGVEENFANTASEEAQTEVESK